MYKRIYRVCTGSQAMTSKTEVKTGALPNTQKEAFPLGSPFVPFRLQNSWLVPPVTRVGTPVTHVPCLPGAPLVSCGGHGDSRQSSGHPWTGENLQRSEFPIM